MSKLIFCYGSMNSGKSMQLLTWKYNYEEAGYKVLLYKPAMDTRGSFKDSENKGVIASRAGLEAPCTLVYDDESFSKYLGEINDPKTIIMLDEAQFLTQKQVKELYEISLKYTVVCFGLKTDFRQCFFEGSKALFELADDIREFKTVCRCGKKATINARLNENGEIMLDGEQIEIGGNEKYKAMCKHCFEKEKNKKM
ncbi:MAG: thymidine kinase [Intestinibacter bartlettii]|uniref:thymidine kinase n=1 Tax=Intestinibacter bartlettii TaxID=261299 RepID=UPI0026EE2460|nr:thymidine kinase [Intestinibacter bartlettii]MDO5009708.1 thymidine kinase [Intestinibacter bartlettii]